MPENTDFITLHPKECRPLFLDYEKLLFSLRRLDNYLKNANKNKLSVRFECTISKRRKKKKKTIDHVHEPLIYAFMLVGLVGGTLTF